MDKKLIRITTVPSSLKHLIKGQMYFMSQNGFDITMISADGEEIKDVINNELCKHIVFQLTRKITPIQDLKATYKLYKFLKKEKPQIVHTHTPKAGIVGMLAAYLANVPNRLHTVAGLPLQEAKGIKRSVLNLVEKLTYKCATEVYPNSFGLKEFILNKNFAKEKKIKVIANGSSNGIDTVYFNSDLFSEEEKQVLKDNLKIKKNDFVFIFVGRLVGDKGINELVAAFKKLQNNSLLNQHFSLLLVGPLESDLDPLLPKTLIEVTNNKDIISVGYQKDVRPYFAISNVLVFPSYREGFPNVVMQAGAMGLPSIVSDINGCNEIIIEGKNGWIIPVKNSEAIFNTMQNCLKNQQQVFEIASQSREMITSRYDQQKVWNAILAEYKSLEENV